MINKKVYIIAEAGVNHNGKLSIAKKIIKEAKEAGADAVKFQTWKKGEITGEFTKSVSYIKKNYKTNLKRSDISDKLQLSYKNFIKLRDYAIKHKITFLSTPDGYESLDFVTNILKVPLIKIGSSELNHSEFIEKAAKTNVRN